MGEEDKKEQKAAAGGDDNILKRFKISSKDFKNGLKWWTKKFAVKPSDKDFSVLLKLSACGKSGCFERNKFLSVGKLSEATRDVKAKEGMKKMKDKASMANMDKEEITNNLALLKEQGKGKKRSCARGACEVTDKSGKKIDAAVVEKENKERKEKADKAKAEWT